MALVGDGVLAVAQGVPQLDGAVTGAGDDLAVVGGERDGQDVVGVADEAAGGGASGELPQAESLVPGGGQGVGAVGRDDLWKRTKFRQRSAFILNIYFPLSRTVLPLAGSSGSDPYALSWFPIASCAPSSIHSFFSFRIIFF